MAVIQIISVDNLHVSLIGRKNTLLTLGAHRSRPSKVCCNHRRSSMASGRRYDCVRKTVERLEGGKQGRRHSRPTFTKRYITILILHPRVPLTHLCVPHSSVVPFPALSLCNGTVIRHTEHRNAVFWTLLKKTTSLHENRNNAKNTKASDFGRSTRTSLIDTPTHYMQSM